MEKTLQQQYNLIKEGKGSKDDFLKSARRIFPEYIAPTTDFKTTIQILKNKSILNEGVGGTIVTNKNKKDWFKIFEENIKEAVGVKDTKEYGNQNEFEKITKEVEDALKTQFDNKDTKNIDNVYGQSFLMGYYTEMKDPKNKDKSVDELKNIVLKNMTKDINYYHINASFGVKGIGYTSEAPGAGIPKEPKGKYKSSGYGDLKESLNENESDKKTITLYKVESLSSKDETVLTDKTGNKMYIYKSEDPFGEGEKWVLYNAEEKNGKLVPTTSYRMSKITVNILPFKDTLKENKETDLKIYKSELNMLNKTKPTGEKQLKRKEFLEKEIAKLETTNESLETRSVGPMTKPSGNEFKVGDAVIFKGVKHKVTRVTDDKIYIKSEKYPGRPETWVKAQDLKKSKTNEALDEAKRPNLASEIKEIEKSNEALALEAKMKSIDEAIEKRKSKLSLAESEELAELVDSSIVKTLQKEIKELEKYKAKVSKIYEKMTGASKKEVIDEEVDESKLKIYELELNILNKNKILNEKQLNRKNFLEESITKILIRNVIKEELKIIK
jgi:NADH:ubiquinone oxidoreductase subunit